MNLKFIKDKKKYLKNTHYQILDYLLNWIFSKNPPKSIILNEETYYWFSLQKIADDTFKSYVQVQRALRRLKGEDVSVEYDDDEPLILTKMVYSRSETNKLYFKLNYKKIIEILDNDNDVNIIKKIKSEVQKMPALFEVNCDEKNCSEKAEGIVTGVLNDNSDLFKTRIARTKAFSKCCTIVQDIYNGQFTNQRIYDISKNIKTSQFDFVGWKERVNSARNDWGKVRDLIECAIGNYRMMFEPRNMPSNKNYLPKSLDKWLYDETNENGYPSYFVFSMKKPKPQRIQYADNEAERMFNELPEKLQEVGVEVCKANNISNKFVFYSNLSEMYDWCKWLINSNINENVDYWVTSPSEIIIKFVDYCDSNNIVINEHTFNVHNSLNNNAPFAWFVSIAIDEHRLNKLILKSCA